MVRWMKRTGCMEIIGSGLKNTLCTARIQFLRIKGLEEFSNTQKKARKKVVRLRRVNTIRQKQNLRQVTYFMRKVGKRSVRLIRINTIRQKQNLRKGKYQWSKGKPCIVKRDHQTGRFLLAAIHFSNMQLKR